MATVIFFYHFLLRVHPPPNFEIAFLTDQTFLSFLSICLTLITAAVWQLLTMSHVNSCSPYMATTSFSTCFSFFKDFYHGKYILFIFNTFFMCFLFLQGEEDYYTRGQAYQGPTRTPTFKVVNRGQLRCI